MFCTGAQLSILLLVIIEHGRQRQLSGVRMILQKLVYLLLIFLLKHRAGCVEQFTILCQQSPQGAQNRRLLAGKGSDIGFPPQQLDIDMPSDDA